MSKESIFIDEVINNSDTECAPAKSGVGIGLPQSTGRTSRQRSSRLFLCAKSPQVMVGDLGSACARRVLVGGKTNLNPLPPNDWSRCVVRLQPHYKEPIMLITRAYVRGTHDPVLIISKPDQADQSVNDVSISTLMEHPTLWPFKLAKRVKIIEAYMDLQPNQQICIHSHLGRLRVCVGMDMTAIQNDSNQDNALVTMGVTA